MHGIHVTVYAPYYSLQYLWMAWRDSTDHELYTVVMLHQHISRP